METGTAILIERMKTNPEEFFDDVYTGKWHRVLDMANACLPEEDKLAIKEARNRMYIDQFNELVLRTLAGEVEQDEGTLTIRSKGRYVTGWNDPRQMALANQTLNNTITSGSGSYITGAALAGANGTSAADILLQPSAFGAVPVSNYSSGES
jgi:hypothetical protein